MLPFDRHWLLTSTFYGNWLPGDEQGCVTTVVGAGPTRARHNIPGAAYDGPMPGLHRSARALLKGDPVRLDARLAEVAVRQFRETAAYRGWGLLAAAVMSNHVHIVVGVPGDPDPCNLQRDFKSYAGRALSAAAGRPAAGTWWTEGGSRRKLAWDGAVRRAVAYVLDQPGRLAVWDGYAPGERGVSAP